MITAVDTSVLIDVFVEDSQYFATSAARLREAMSNGVVMACDVVWAECAGVFDAEKAFLDVMRTLGVVYSPVSAESAAHAGTVWREYRKAGGKRDRVVADFLIGAHAVKQCDALLTRDRGFYRKYFSALKVIDPSR